MFAAWKDKMQKIRQWPHKAVAVFPHHDECWEEERGCIGETSPVEGRQEWNADEDVNDS
jgi:hypothetical protein